MRAILVVVSLIVFFNSSCGNDIGVPPENRISSVANTNSTETPVPLQPTKENQGRRCEARAYTNGGGDRNDNPTCYRLQVRLAEAARGNNLAEIREALRYGANPEATFNDNHSALHTAAVYGNAEAAQLLLDNGANVNDGNFISGTPLMAAANSGHINVVKVLLARGADVCIAADGGRAIDGARRSGHKEIVELLQAAEAEKCK